MTSHQCDTKTEYQGLIWPGPFRYHHDMPHIESAPCFSQFIHKDEVGKKGDNARKKLATLTAKTAATRIKQCNEQLKKFEGQMGIFQLMALSATEDPVHFDRDLWTPPDGEQDWSKYTFQETLQKVNESIFAFCRKQKEKARKLHHEAVLFYEKKQFELQKVEKSLAKSKKQAQKTMEEHWEVITNTEWCPLNNPHILQNVLGFLPMHDLAPIMRTCSQMLHFVHYQVPLSVIALDMGNQSFNKWLSSFHHFHSLDCSSITNMRKGSMYPNLSKIAKNKRIDALTVGQPAKFKPKNFEKFQKTFQQHQKYLIELTVEASMVPCFLSDEQLGKLKKLTLLNLNKDKESITRWVESFNKLTSLEVLTISCYDFDLKNISIPANVNKLHILKSSSWIEEDARYGAKVHRDWSHGSDIAVPNLEHCEKLEEVHLDGVHDLTSLSLLKNPLKVLKIRGTDRDCGNNIWPTCLHAKQLALSGVFPPLEIVQTEELTLSALSCEQVSQVVSSPICKELTKFELATFWFPLRSYIEWEHSLEEGVTFSLGSKKASRISLLLKYALLEYAKFPNRCTVCSTPIRDVSDDLFAWDRRLCQVCGKEIEDFIFFDQVCLDHELNQKCEADKKEVHVRKVHEVLGNEKKRKSSEGDSHEGEPPLKKQKVDDIFEW